MNHFISLTMIFLLTIIPSSFAWHFLLKEGSSRCIYEEFPKNEFVIIEMRLLDKISDDAFQGVNVELKDITQQTIIQKKVVPYNQTFSTKMSFVSDKGGSYEICASTNSESNWLLESRKFGFQIRVTYEVDPQLEDEKFKDAATSANMEEIHTTFRKLYSKSKHLINSQDLNRQKEFKLFEENNAINEKIIFCTLFQIVVIIISGVFQIFSLRAFLIKRSLY